MTLNVAFHVRSRLDLSMRTLIDGYNVMFALGLMGERFGPDQFRKVRQRFLNLLAEALGPVDAHQTTVVFDAAEPPADLPSATTHKGISVLFAVANDSADERIEELIAEHSAPKSLTVVSSDNRLRQAALRRKARCLTADEFCTELEASRPSRQGRPPAPPDPERQRERTLSPRETDYWLREFGALDDEPETEQALNSEPGMLTDAEIAALEREIERELGPS